MTHAQIGAALGRTAGSVKAFCRSHGLVVERLPWTDTELDIVRQGVAAGETSAQIAARLPGRTVPMVGRQRSELGITRKIRTDGLDDLIAQKHAEQWSDGEIAAEWNRRQSDTDSVIRREAVSEHRRKLGLEAHGITPRLRARVA